MIAAVPSPKQCFSCFVAASRTRAKKNFMVLTFNISSNSDANLAVSLSLLPTAAARATLFIVILIPSYSKYGRAP